MGLLPAAGYGASRAYLSNWITPYTNKLFGQFGPYADNLGMGLVNFGIAKFAGGVVRQAAIDGIKYEVADAAREAVSGSGTMSANAGAQTYNSGWK
jgi:hypothetical protein